MISDWFSTEFWLKYDGFLLANDDFILATMTCGQVTFERNTCLHQMMSAISGHDGGHAPAPAFGLSYKDIVIEGLLSPPSQVPHDISYGYKLIDLQIIQSHYSGPDMLRFFITNDELFIKNDDLCIKHDDFCITMMTFVLTNDEFCIKTDQAGRDQRRALPQHHVAFQRAAGCICKLQ